MEEGKVLVLGSKSNASTNMGGLRVMGEKNWKKQRGRDSFLTSFD